jgi:hypothetical protein
MDVFLPLESTTPSKERVNSTIELFLIIIFIIKNPLISFPIEQTNGNHVTTVSRGIK